MSDLGPSLRLLDDRLARQNGHAPAGGSTRPRQPEKLQDKPELRADNGDLDYLTDMALLHIRDWNKPPVLFQFGDDTVRLTPDVDGSASSLRSMTVDMWRRDAAKAIAWKRVVRKKSDGKKPDGDESTPDDATADGDEGELVDAHPPIATCKNLNVTPAADTGFPVMRRIVTSPVVARDGSLVTSPGFHRAGGIYLEACDLSLPAVPPRPTPADISQARALLDELLIDFPFRGPKEGRAERANAISMILNPIVLDLIDGPTPLYLVNAPKAGTGKGLLASVAALISTGRVTPASTLPNNDDETRKRLTAVLSQAPQIILFDNVPGSIASADLAAALTASTWIDRQLGSTRMLTVPIHCTWIATGNNPNLTDEMARRSVGIRLDAQDERPEERGAFRHPHLLKWVREHRGELVWAALVLVQAWIAQGRPVGGTRLGSFESWAEIHSGILKVAGIEGFMENARELHEVADVESAAWVELVTEWWERYRDQDVRAGALYAIAREIDGIDLGGGNDHSQRVRFGKALGQQRDRIFDGFKIVSLRTRHKQAMWSLAPQEREEHAPWE